MTILFFDTETTGLPNLKLPASANGQPRIVQLAAILTDDFGNIKSQISFIVQPDGWIIPDHLSGLHGISTNDAMKHGLSMKGVISVFKQLLLRADILVGHNMLFDKCMIDIESFKTQVQLDFPSKYVCTMNEACEIVQCPPTQKMIDCGMGDRFKNPNLSEAYKHFFGVDFEGAHNAMNDVTACKDIYFAMFPNELPEKGE